MHPRIPKLQFDRKVAANGAIRYITMTDDLSCHRHQRNDDLKEGKKNAFNRETPLVVGIMYF